MVLACLGGQAQNPRPSRPGTAPVVPGPVIETFEQHRTDGNVVVPTVIDLPPGRAFNVDFASRAEHLQLPEPDAGELQEKVSRAQRAEPRRAIIGIPRQTSFSPRANGAWLQVSAQSNQRVWAMTFSSAASLGIRLHFTSFSLPEGSKLYLYSPETPEQAQVLRGKGPYGNSNFWSTIIRGDTIVLELLTSDEGQVQSADFFQVHEISHLFKDSIGPLGDPGSCNLDASCYSAWSDTGDSVARIIGTDYDGTFACSGTLVADQANDFSPLFLTAAHCFNSDDVAKTAIVFWLFKTASCNGKAPNIYTVPQTDGAALMNWNSPVDATLLYLTGSVPNYIPFTGWTTADPAINDNITAIHHPRGSWRRISSGHHISDDPSYNTYHQVLWSSGVTEPGSSGSPALNAAHQIVGQLSLGSSSCQYPQGTDFYGKLSLNFDSLNLTGDGNVLQSGTPDTDAWGSHWTRATAGNLSLPLALSNLKAKIGHDDWFKFRLSKYWRIKLHFRRTDDRYNPAQLLDNLYQGDSSTPLDIRDYLNGNPTTIVYRNNGADSDYYLQINMFQGAYATYEVSVDLGKPEAPSASLEQVIGVGVDSGYVQSIVGTGGVPSTYYYEYATSPDFSNSQTTAVRDADMRLLAWDEGTEDYTMITGLQANTKYYYRLHVTNDLGSAVSATGTFTTLAYFRSAYFQPASLDFGTITAGMNTQRGANLVNTGTILLAPGSATIGDDFTIDPAWGCDYWGQQCYFTIYLNTSKTGVHSSTLVVVDHDQTYTLPVTANVVIAPYVYVNTDFTYFSQNVWVGQPVFVTSTVQVAGSAPFTFTGVQVTGDLREISHESNCTPNLSVGSTCTVTVGITPVGTGARAGYINLLGNAANTPYGIYFYLYGIDRQENTLRPPRPKR